MPPAPMPLAVGRGTDGFPEGCPDMVNRFLFEVEYNSIKEN